MYATPLRPDGSIDVARLFADDQRFVRTLGPTVVEATPTTATLRLDAPTSLHNHLGGPHAAALFGLGELTAFALLLQAFGDLVQGGAVPFIKSGAIDFSALVTGAVLATATLVDEPGAVRARFSERRSASFDCEVLFRLEATGAQTTAMRPRMTLKQL